MPSNDWRSRARYGFDNYMGRGPIALIGWLFLASLILVVSVSLIVLLLGVAPEGPGGQPAGLGRLLWMGLMRAMDAGTVAGDEGSPLFLLLMLLITFGGIFIFSTLIGLLTTGIEAKIEDLRKGRSQVIEEGHTVILGWSPQVFTVLGELITANENQRRAVVAILADADKVEMEDAIRERIDDLKTTRVVCRSGSPLDPLDLERVNPQQAKAILVLPPEQGDPDAQILKTVLALVNSPTRQGGRYHIVTQVRDPRTVDLVRMVGKDEVQVVSSSDFVARTMVQTSRQAGLSVVWTELLDFGGDEIYIQAVPSLAGKTFGEALLAFEDSAVIGLAGPGGARVNPPMDTPIDADTAIIAISADDDTVVPRSGGAPPIDADAIAGPQAHEPRPERIIILGWNLRASTIITELDQYVAPGTAVTVVAEGIDALPDDCNPVNETLALHRGDPTDRRLLDSLDMGGYDHVIVLSELTDGDVQQADARTLTTLLHLRDIEEQRHERYNIVSEMLDPRNRELAQVTKAEDFIVSDQLVSLMMTQLLENRNLAPCSPTCSTPKAPSCT